MYGFCRSIGCPAHKHSILLLPDTLATVSGVVCRLFEGMDLHGPIKNPSGPMLLKLGTHKLYVVLSNIRDEN